VRSVHGYSLTARVFESRTTLVERGFRTSDGQRVIVKSLRNPYPTASELSRIRDEHALLVALRTPAAVRALDLLSLENGLALVLEDLGDTSVARSLESPLGIKAFLDLALSMADALASIHAEGVIHGDITPHHFFLADGASQARLIDFGLSLRLSPQVRAVAVAHVEGTLAYISPERTGRMNQLVDRRSDQYGLGVTLYHLLTGRLPFETTDPLELVHSHIARTPRPADELRPDAPPVLSQIIAKLLSKGADQRYHTVAALMSDLQRCLATLSADGHIPWFPIGGDDSSGELSIPQKLYGREAASRAIAEAAEQVQQGASLLLTITGPSGIGKSAVVREIEKALRSGRFVSGKFDQLARGLPYSAVVQACRQLLRGVLAESAERIAGFRQRLLQALGANAGLLSGALPELVLVIGPHPDPPPLGPIEAQSRFERSFHAFLLAFASPDHPLCLFLDDLQWADPASLRLLNLVLTAPDTGHLLVVGAYRDNEIDAMHPLSLALTELRDAGLHAKVLALSPLTAEDVALFLGDTLDLPPIRVRSLAALLMRKTEGNPFYLRQLLVHLHAKGVVAWDATAKHWRWDEERIEAEPATDNVVDFMIARLQGLPHGTRNVLRLAACIGHQFDQATLMSVAETTGSDLDADIEVALETGLILAVDRRGPQWSADDAQAEAPGLRYRFLHDRVQHAAYSLLETDQRHRVHLRIGRSLATSLGARPSEEHLFAAVNHLDAALPLIVDRDERLRLARLNLEAGGLALRAAAHAAAAGLLDLAIAIFDEDAWASEREAARAAYLARATCAFLTSDFDLAHRLLARLDADSRTPLERAAPRALEAVVFTGQTRVQEAAAHTVEAAGQLGLELPLDPAAIDAAIGPAFAELQGLLAEHSDESLLALPAMVDPEKLALMDLLCRAFPALYQANTGLSVLATLRAMALQLRHGNAPIAPFFYANCGVVHARATGDLEGADRFGRLALKLAARLQNRAVDGATYFIVGAFLAHWKTHLGESVSLLRQGLKLSFEGGDGAHAGYCARVASIYSFYAGRPLPEALADLESIEDLLRRNGNLVNAHYVRLYAQTVENLRGRTADPRSLAGKNFDEAEFLGTARKHPALSHSFWHCKQLVLYLGGHFAESLAAAERARPVAVAFFMEGVYELLRGLAIAGVVRSGAPRDHEALLAELAAIEETHRKWAAANPANSGARHALIAAELAAATGRLDEANDLYDQAIRAAREHGFLYCEAIANELAGRFHGARGRQRIAASYLADARHAYLRWGATAKAAALGEEFPDIVAPAEPSSDVSSLNSISRAGASGGLDLDLLTAIRTMQAIGAELDLDRLVERVLRMLTENAGAQRGLFVLREGDTLRVVAETRLIPEHLAIRLGEPVDGTVRLAASVVQLAVRSREAVVVADAGADPRLARDAYVAEQRPRSVLCLPLLHQGSVSGAAYFENNSAPQVFSPTRVELLQLLAGQAATAVENARLYGELRSAGEELRRANATLEQKVEERTRELGQSNQALRVVLDNVDQGLFLVDLDGRVLEERSAIMYRWFGPSEGRPALVAWIGADARFADAFTLGMEAIRDNVLPLSLCIDQLPTRLVAGGRQFACRYLPVEDHGALRALLCVLDDMTERLKHEHEEAEQRELVATFTAFARDRAGFLVFFQEAQGMFRELERIDVHPVTRKRLLHTLKGNARVPGLDGVAELCHRAETELETEGEVSFATWKRLRDRWSVVARAVETVAGTETHDVIELCAKDVDDLERRIEGGASSRELLAEVMRLRWEPVERPLERLAAHARALGRSLKKADLDLRVQADRLRLDPDRFTPLWSALVHLVRNAIDHGIETADARAAAGKPARGVLRLQARGSDGWLVVEVEDDGRGIDWDTARRLCRERGLPCETRGDLVSALFRPDFSSRGQVSEISGRGVGLAAVAASVSERGGTITVESEPGTGTRWILKLPLSGAPPAAPSVSRRIVG
jgi:predicted ATPase/GAF domain-containing protein/HPt (histidine-containing phosphotransfer) domain-containing protein